MRVPARVRYRERQRLRAADLRDEQDYLLGLDGRHNVGPHEWGIVRGLQILIDEKTWVATLVPGIAIDGYGRELVVAQPVPLDLQPTITTHYVYLFYCERPGGKCGERSNNRWNDSVAMAVSEDLLPLPDEPDASLARVAGSLPDEPFWPVLLGVVTFEPGKPPAVSISEVRYTSIHAGPIRHSTGRTAMRVGQETLIDPYHFLVTSRGEDGVTQNRLAIDRDGNLQFWKDVIVESASKSAAIDSPIPGVRINSQLRPLVGSDVKVQVSKVTIDSTEVFKILFQGKAPDGSLVSEPLFIKTNLKSVTTLNKELSKFNDNSQLVTLSGIGKKISSQTALTRSPRTSPRARSTASASSASQTLVADDGPTSFEFGAARIQFQPEQEAEKREFCGCADPDEKAGRLPEGLVFHPGPSPPAIPARDIYCIRISKPNSPPVDNLRIVGGLLRKGDLNPRIVLGDTNNATGLLNVFRPWLAFRGNGALEIYGGDRQEDQLSVTGLVELAPIKPDPRDPVFNALSVLAFIKGVLSSGAELLELTFTNVPAFIETNQPWGYKLTIRNKTTVNLTTVPGNSELITAGTTIFPRRIPGVTPLGAGATTSNPLEVLHTPTNIPLDPTITEITVDVAIAMGGTITVAGAGKITIPVVPSPTIDLSRIPLHVPVTSPPQSFTIRIDNPSADFVSIDTVRITGAIFQSRPTLPHMLNPHDFVDASITIMDASPPLVTVSIEITYSRNGVPAITPLERHREVDVS